MAYTPLVVAQGAASDTGVTGGTKLNSTIGSAANLQAGVGLALDATSIGDVLADAGALAASDTILARIKKLKGAIDAGGGGGATLALSDLGVDYDISSATSTVRGTTFVNQANTAISSQYPLSADGLWNLEIRASSALSSQGFSGGELLDYLAIRHDAALDIAKVYYATRAGGVMSPWKSLDGLPPSLLTQDIRERTHLPVATNASPLGLVQAGFYQLPVTTIAGTVDLPFSPPVDTSMTWRIQVDRLDLEGIITASAVYSDGGAPPMRHTHTAEVTVANAAALTWSTPQWRYVSGTRSQNPERGRPTQKAARYELWGKLGQSGSVGAAQLKEVGVNTDAYQPLGKDAPHPRVFEVSRGLTFSPTIHAPQHELNLFSANAWDSGNNTITFSQYFGAARCDDNPEIEKLAIVNSAVGATAMSAWLPGTGNFANAVSRINGFLLRHPEFHFAGIIWHQGESDALATRTQAQYEADVATMVAGFRAQITNAADSAFICGTMSKAWRDVTTGSSGQATVAIKDGIHQAHLRTPKYIPNSAVVDLDDLIEIPNTPAWQASANTDDQIIHFNRQHQREMGRRYALASDGVVAITQGVALPSYRMRYDAVSGKYVNGLDRDVGQIFEGRYVSDPTRGMVLSTDVLGDGTQWQGFLSDLVHSVATYTIALRVRSKGTIANGQSLVSHGANNLNQAKLITVNAISHGNATATGTGFAGSIPADTWVHLAVTFDGTNFQRYIDGVADGAAFPPQTGLTPPFDTTALGQCQVGRWENGANQQWQGLLDDIFVCSSALPPAEVANLFRS